MYTFILISCFQDAVKQVVKDDHRDHTFRDYQYRRRRVYEIEARLRILEAYQQYRRLYGGTNSKRYR